MTTHCEHCGRECSNRRFCSRKCLASSRQLIENSNWRGGKSFHPLYGIYNEMVARCTNPTHKRWADYGGRGIKVCARWRDDFWHFVSDMGPRPEGTSASGRTLWTLDRRNNDGDYSPENCRWVDNYTQTHNRRSREPRTHCKNGHEFTDESTYIHRGSRSCLTCRRDRDKRRNRKATA